MEVNGAVLDSMVGIRGEIYSEINFHQFLQRWYYFCLRLCTLFPWVEK